MAATACGVREVEPDIARLEEPSRVRVVSVHKVEVMPIEASDELNRGAEHAGLVTALLDLGLADLPGVIPETRGLPPGPGLDDPLSLKQQHWTLQGTLGLETLDVSFCPDDGACEIWRQPAKTDALTVPVAAVLGAIEERLRRVPSVPAREARALPPSPDAYADLLAGRSLASLVGTSSAAAPGDVGHKRRDPVTRAHIVDPGSAPSAWLVARRDASLGEIDRARDALPRARARRPTSTALAALDAALLVRGEQPAAALSAWLELLEHSVGDGRFVLPTVRAALAARQYSVALSVLDSLPPVYQDDPGVLALRVALSDAGAAPAADEALLARWQQAAPELALPVRRRIRLRLRAGDLAGALSLTEELRRRGDSVDGLVLAMAIGLGDPGRARAAAAAMGHPELGRRIDARFGRDLNGLPSDATTLHLVALQALDRGAPDDALAAATTLLEADAWSPEALTVQAEALTRLGRTDEAEVARARAYWADPGPSTAAGATATGSQAQGASL